MNAAADFVALRQLVDAYADAVDRRDPSDLVSLFTADAEVTAPSPLGRGQQTLTGPAIADIIESVSGYERTFHHVGGAVFSVDADRATGRATCLAHHYDRTRSGPTDLVMMIRYEDEYAKQDGAWLISRRQVTADWTALHPAHPRRDR